MNVDGAQREVPIMEASETDGSAKETSEPWWATDPEIEAIRQQMMDEFGPGSTRPAEPQAPESPDPVLVEVLSGASTRELSDARDGLHRARRRYAEAVGTARAAGLSWGEIGNVLGVSRQALHRRFGDLDRVD
jgi:hypothetical protein